MRIWYYAIAGEQSAPIPEVDLVQLFAQERLREETLVWTEGLEDWQPASQFEIFFPQLEQEQDWQKDREEEVHQPWEEDSTEWVPPQSATSKKQKGARKVPLANQDSVRPWARFFARKIDIALAFMLMDWVYTFQEYWRFNTAFYQGVFLMLGFLILEPIFLVLFGAS